MSGPLRAAPAARPAPSGAPPHVVVVNDRAVAEGGATALALLSARGLAARGARVTYLSGDAGSEDLRDRGVSVDALGQRAIAVGGSGSTALRGWYNRAAADALARHVARDDGRSVYHVHGWSKILSPSVFVPLAAVADRVVVHAHDFFLACPNGAYMDYRRERVCTRRPLGLDCLSTNCDKRSYAQKLWRCGRQASLKRAFGPVAHAARVLAIHEGMRAGLVRAGLPDASIRTLRNPATAWCAERVPAEANSTLFYVGQVTAEKGVDAFLEAARALGAPAEVIGDGEARAALQREHPEARFHGRLARDAIAAEIRRARAVVVPSRYPEPFGLVIAEASLSGIPVVLSDSALLAAEIESHGLGTAFAAGVPGALGRALRTVLGLRPDDVEAISRRAHAGRAALALSEEAWIDALLFAYAERTTP